MQSVNDVLKINALCLMLIGTLLVLMPDQANTFLNASNNIPKLLLLSVGIAMNLCALLLLNFAKSTRIKSWQKNAAIVIDVIWGLFLLASLALQIWITAVNGMTVSGLLIIGLGWSVFALLNNKNP